MTLLQKIKRKIKFKLKKIRTPRLNKCPHKKGICQKVFITTPKKPNSAQRKATKIWLGSTGEFTNAYIPGIGHNLQKFSTVLIRGGRVKDLPGMRYKVIRGKFDAKPVFSRRQSRSKYGVKYFGLKKKKKLQMSKKINTNEIYDSILINKFINCFQRKGKKFFIEKIFYSILVKLKKRELNGLLIWFYCIEIVKPLIILLPSIRSGITYHTGSMLSFQEQYFIAIKWLVSSISSQRKKSLEEKIVEEILNTVIFFKSNTLKKKKENYNLIFKNRALTHFRWR